MHLGEKDGQQFYENIITLTYNNSPDKKGIMAQMLWD